MRHDMESCDQGGEDQDEACRCFPHGGSHQ